MSIQELIDEISRFLNNDSELWHFRLAHASYKTLTRLPDIPRKYKLFSNAVDTCEACLVGKLKETFSKKPENRTSKITHRLHSDIRRKFPT